MISSEDAQNGTMDQGDPAEGEEPGTAQLPNDRLNKDQPPSTEGTGAPMRKSSLLGD